ncbi:Abscisic acid-insensitive 5-like protein 5 [Apostasia shenzhenica]|uniref:Abscisic acid-insensitive 5-like protein 5 n=1 Tax=Apostasia shenzhenica TaxID=1088818 RepID=A0A2I0AKL3_9ASPA|nr:Abscisic acid-insensitive 5-like protein 5 [Apostasia shenzhenica]
MSFKGILGIGGKDVQQHPGPPLARQSSIYSLTFEELQSTMGGLGKDFGSMNMDEFLKNIWTAEETQAMANSVRSSVGCEGAEIQRQGSLTLPRTLSQKTVDEVWRDLMSPGGDAGAAGPDLQQHQRQLTLGEMTLEEFLVRAGVVKEEVNPLASGPLYNTAGGCAGISGSVYYGDMSSPPKNNNARIALGFPTVGPSNMGMMSSSISPGANVAMSASQLPMGSDIDLGNSAVSNGLIPGVVSLGGRVVKVGASASPANNIINSDGLTTGNGELSSVSPVPYVFDEGLKVRKCSGAVEKIVERRQRRMIKNRESAARSRARKQAYTMELEAEVAKLKEQNQELQKKQAETSEKHKNQVLEFLNQQCRTKKICLRRTQTGPW